MAFSHVDSSDVTKADHPLASRIPKPSIRPAVVGDPDETLPLACGPGCPTSIDDYLYHDRPALGLHIVSLKDATLVTLHWLHIACDAMGMEALVRGWVLAMKGLPILGQQGFDNDPLLELGTHPTEEHVLANDRMSSWAMTEYGMRNGYGLLVAKKECRMVCIPGAFMDKLRGQALEELKEAGEEDPFLTENDVLVAWWTRMALSHLSAESPRPVTVQVAMSLRKALSEDLLASGKPYISNCFGFTNLLTTVQGIRKQPVSSVASQWRSAINTQGTRAQVEAYQAMVRESVAPLPVFFGNGQTYQVSYSNWTKADLYGADFSAAAVTPRTEPLYASYIAHCQVPFQFPEGFIIVGKDQARNTWLCGYRALGLWDRVIQELNSLEDA